MAFAEFVQCTINVANLVLVLHTSNTNTAKQHAYLSIYKWYHLYSLRLFIRLWSEAVREEKSIATNFCMLKEINIAHKVYFLFFLPIIISRNCKVEEHMSESLKDFWGNWRHLMIFWEMEQDIVFMPFTSCVTCSLPSIWTSWVSSAGFKWEVLASNIPRAYDSGLHVCSHHG